MNDITRVVENFRNTLQDIAKKHRTVAQTWNCDDWEELSELLYEIFVISPVLALESVRIGRCYENWSPERFDVELIVTVSNFQSRNLTQVQETNGLLVSLASPCSSFFFVEFGHPLKTEDDIDRFNYVSGIKDSGEKVFIGIEDCQFFV